MSGTHDDKTLLAAYNNKRYQAFTLNDTPHLELIRPSIVPGIITSSRRDIYQKIQSHPTDHHVKFITKNDKPHAFYWQTNSEKLKQAARWGIVKTESTTGKVIASLGKYRIAAHKRVLKGMVSNSQALKLKLLDLFQERFEALQEIESLINRSQTFADYQAAFLRYDAKLVEMSDEITEKFRHVEWTGFDGKSIGHLEADLARDRERAQSFFSTLNAANLAHHNRARGHDSTSEFVKQQMLHGLYELQGINQDITYSNQRDFALTRGELNDAIEDARKEMDEHQTDLVNAVTPEHHGLYSTDPNKLFTYDFSSDHLSTSRERDVLLALSFIEGWDTLEDVPGQTPRVYNASGSESLDTIAATRWKTHRSFWVALKSFGFYVINLVKSFFVSTHPWEEETWTNPQFHLQATELIKHARENQPLWRKPFQFFKQLGIALIDIVKGIRNLGLDFVIEMPADIVNDWQASGALPELNQTLDEVTDAINHINITEAEALRLLLQRCNYIDNNNSPPALSEHAYVNYTLEVGEQNDILSAMARGLNEFGSVFSHNIYAKDPFAGLVFTAAYALGAAALYLPSLTSSVMGSNYVKAFSDFAYSMAASKPAAVIAGASTQAQIAALGVDFLEHGQSGMAMDVLYQMGEDPLTVAAYGGVAYMLGYLVLNGINGQAIPWVSEHLREDLGTAPGIGYSLMGGKGAILLHEMFASKHADSMIPLTLSVDGRELGPALRDNQQIRLIHWLLANLKTIPQLTTKQLFTLERHLDSLFSKEESISLKKMLYPKKPHSIAFQLLYIPLSYIPMLLRCLFSVFLSIGAAIARRPHPLAPMEKAFGPLAEKIKKDVSRLLVFGSFLLYTPYMFIATMVKMLAYCTTMIVGRMAGWCQFKTGHAVHQAFAAIHGFFRRAGEFLYPVSILKQVTPAHPMHTIKEIESSYKKLVLELGRPRPAQNLAAAEDENHAAIFQAAMPAVLVAEPRPGLVLP